MHGLDEVTRVGDDPKGRLHPRKPPAAELGTVTGAGCLSAPAALAAAEQCAGSPFSLVSSILLSKEQQTGKENKED